jgi:hypothetical protein
MPEDAQKEAIFMVAVSGFMKHPGYFFHGPYPRHQRKVGSRKSPRVQRDLPRAVILVKPPTHTPSFAHCTNLLSLKFFKELTRLKYYEFLW